MKGGISTVTILDTFLHFSEGEQRGFPGILQKIVQSVTSLSDKISFLNATVLSIAAIAVCAVIGIFGYKLLKIVSALLAAYVGYTAGVNLTVFLAEKISWFPSNTVLRIVIGAIIGTGLFLLAFKQHKFFAAIVAGVFAYDFFLTCLGGVVFLAVGAALIVALLFMYFEKVFTVLALSFASAFSAIAFLNRLLPKVTFLLLYPNGGTKPALVGFLIAAGIGAVFSLIQFLSNRHFDHDDNYYY